MVRVDSQFPHIVGSFVVPTDDNSEDWRDFFPGVVSVNDRLMNKKERRGEKERRKGWRGMVESEAAE